MSQGATPTTAFHCCKLADGAMGKISDNLQRMRELAVQAKNGTLNPTDRVNLNREYTELANEVDRIVSGSTFNGNNLFDAANQTLSFQVGTGNAVSDTLELNLTDDGLSTGNDLTTIMTNGAADIQTNLGDIIDVANATTAIDTLDASIDAITGIRAVVGAGQSRLEQVAAFADTSSTNLQAARGRIMDADFAKENGSTDPLTDSSAGWHRHARPGQPVAQQRSEPVAVMDRTKR